MCRTREPIALFDFRLLGIEQYSDEDLHRESALVCGGSDTSDLKRLRNWLVGT